jgi:hypothetical protein
MAQWVFGYGAHAGAMWSDLGPVYPACPDAQVLEVEGVAGVTDSDNSVPGSSFGRLVKRSNTKIALPWCSDSPWGTPGAVNGHSPATGKDK